MYASIFATTYTSSTLIFTGLEMVTSQYVILFGFSLRPSRSQFHISRVTIVLTALNSLISLEWSGMV